MIESLRLNGHGVMCSPRSSLRRVIGELFRTRAFVWSILIQRSAVFQIWHHCNHHELNTAQRHMLEDILTPYLSWRSDLRASAIIRLNKLKETKQTGEMELGSPVVDDSGLHLTGFLTGGEYRHWLIGALQQSAGSKRATCQRSCSPS